MPDGRGEHTPYKYAVAVVYGIWLENIPDDQLIRVQARMVWAYPPAPRL